ncbi:hypothetical protein V6X63_10310 [Spiribacter sp. 221]|uniref:hypothetical protein n=1 Tax=Spiribacter onubensis TaxID=3122420 RepID=UPI00349F87CB
MRGRQAARLGFAVIAMSVAATTTASPFSVTVKVDGVNQRYDLEIDQGRYKDTRGVIATDGSAKQSQQYRVGTTTFSSDKLVSWWGNESLAETLQDAVYEQTSISAAAFAFGRTNNNVNVDYIAPNGVSDDLYWTQTEPWVIQRDLPVEIPEINGVALAQGTFVLTAAGLMLGAGRREERRA